MIWLYFCTQIIKFSAELWGSKFKMTKLPTLLNTLNTFQVAAQFHCTFELCTSSVKLTVTVSSSGAKRFIKVNRT